MLDHCVNLSDDGLAHLSGMHQLRALSLEGCANITGRGFDSFKMLGRSLTQLNLNQLRSLSDSALEHISGFSELRVLRLGWCNRISDAGVFKLLPRPREGLHKLQSLSLDHTAISDAAADVLVGFDDLRVVKLGGCNVTNQTLSRLLSERGAASRFHMVGSLETMRD